MLNKQGKGKIDWTNYTWNPVSGCLHGCPYCYLDRIRGFDKTPAFHPERLKELDNIPNNEPSFIFVGSSGDMFGKWVPSDWISEVIKTMEQYPQHTFQLLTKNPVRYHEFIFPVNCWLGTTVDGTTRTQNNLELLKDVARKGRNKAFVSFEPLLEEVHPTLDEISWVIIGGKSGNPPFYPPEFWVNNIIHAARERCIKIFIKDNAKFSREVKEFPQEMFYEP